MAIIDLAFVLVGTTFPLDHGYSLFSAISRIVPRVHGDRRIGIHPIRGRRNAPGLLQLHEQSRLKIRLPSEEIAPYIALAGQVLELDGHRLQVGIPRVDGLISAASLASRMVTFKHALTPEKCLEDVRQRLEQLGIKATPELVVSSQPFQGGQAIRRVLRIKDRKIVGFSLRVTGLSPEESIRLQEHGLGGRRRMGCGVFTPWNS
ncbi:MAG: type I-MYXAN CRISPR-associated protein Cas6/Cmx6 [Planctomycetes bacterium SCN 63-9]|nr:MAG: type I-MYXAN CRISPR-associated protein Cas6/Cmx6 [Planctomycetes bacterium SCN 63-9]